MMRVLVRGGAEVQTCDAPGAIWFDLESPEENEETQVETALGVEVPTPAERAAIEESARFYEDGGALYLTATLLGRREEGKFVSGPVTFILAQDKLVTVRQIKPRAFEVGQGRASARIGKAKSGADVFLSLLEGAAERLADLLSEASNDAQGQSLRVFTDKPAPDLRDSLQALGRIGMLTALTHDSLSSLQRLLAYTRSLGDKHGMDGAKLQALERDIAELERAAESLQMRISYLQDAALGLINSTQTDVLKALSLATIAFVPPTLIASVFGMNFQAMTWFQQPWGPWVAALLMVIAPATLFGVAKWRGWF
jgi:magnesium transporter